MEMHRHENGRVSHGSDPATANDSPIVDSKTYQL
jgi:hypothetical protein